MTDPSVSGHTSTVHRVRHVFHRLAISVRVGCREISDVLTIPVTIGLFVLYVVVCLPVELLWSFFVAQNVLWAFLLVSLTTSPVIYGVLKRIKHESQYSSIPKEGWEGIPLEDLPEAVDEYKKLIKEKKDHED